MPQLPDDKEPGFGQSILGFEDWLKRQPKEPDYPTSAPPSPELPSAEEGNKTEIFPPW